MAELQYDADYYAAEAMAAELDQVVVFDGTSGEVTFEDWLEGYKPSLHSKYDGIGWICVRLPDKQLNIDTLPDVVGLQESWESLQHSGRPINYKTITELANMHGVTSGKWFLHVETGAKVDHFWSLIARGVMEGRLGDSAKVSPCDTADPDYKHIICIYNNNFTNEEEVIQLENGLRRCGIKSPMKYKPDVYSYLGIYRKNKWGLRPSVYESVYDICMGASRVLPITQDDEHMDT